MAIIIRMLVNEKGYLFWGLYRNRKNIQPDWLGPFFNSFAYTIFTVHISFDTVIVYWLMFSHITNPFYNGLVLWDLCKEPCELENVTHRDTFFFLIYWHWKFQLGWSISSHFITPLWLHFSELFLCALCSNLHYNKADKGCKLLLMLKSGSSDFLS